MEAELVAGAADGSGASGVAASPAVVAEWADARERFGLLVYHYVFATCLTFPVCMFDYC